MEKFTDKLDTMQRLYEMALKNKEEKCYNEILTYSKLLTEDMKKFMEDNNFTFEYIHTVGDYQWYKVVYNG